MFKIIRGERFADQFDRIVHITIFVSFVVFALETVKELKEYNDYFQIVEYISLVVFTLEYAFRVYIAYHEKRAMKYVLSFIGLVDLLSIMPLLLLPFTSAIDLRFVKIFRLFSLFRIFKLYRYYDHLKAIIKVVENKKGDLLATLFSIFIVVVFCSCMAYYFEKDAQPVEFNNLFQAMYWGVSTLAIGYGDVVPITIGGKLTAIILAMVGIGLITIPSAILSVGFIEELQARKLKKNIFTPPTPPVSSEDGKHEPNTNARRHEVKQTDQNVEEEVEKLL
jgi:voltage-gated potassium channel